MIEAITGAGLAGLFCLSVILASQLRRNHQERLVWRSWYAKRTGGHMRTQQQQQPAAMILEPVTGQQEGKLRKCIVCQQELGLDWIRISRTGVGYSVAAHPGCLARRSSDGAG